MTLQPSGCPELATGISPVIFVKVPDVALIGFAGFKVLLVIYTYLLNALFLYPDGH
jgi:hypothetical protein